MKQINSVSLTAATLGAMTSFYQSVQALIVTATPVVLHIETQAPAYATLVAQLIEVQNRQRAMTTTINTKQADADRDAIIGFIYQLIGAMQFSPKDAEALAAARLKLIIASYPKLSQLELERETTQIEGLLRDLSTEQAGKDLNTLKMVEYVELLEESNTAFIIASATRSTEAQARAAVAGGEKSGDLRQQTATAYKQIVQLVNAFAIAIPNAKINTFVDGVNGEIINLEKVIAVEMAANTRARNKNKK